MALYEHLPLPFPWLPPTPHYHDGSSCGLATAATKGTLQSTEPVSVGNIITLQMLRHECWRGPAATANYRPVLSLERQATVEVFYPTSTWEFWMGNTLCTYVMYVKTPWSESASELYRPSDRHLSAKCLPTFADRGCHMVSVTDPYGRILDFMYRSRYLFLPSSSSLVLMRLSGPRSRPTTFFFWQCRESNPGLRICSQELWPLDHRGGHVMYVYIYIYIYREREREREIQNAQLFKGVL
jgi:hypothetical protein